MAREELAGLGASLFDRRPTFGRTGNLSVRSGDRILMTPTGSSLGGPDPGELAGLRPDLPTRPLTDDQAEQLRREDP